VGKEDQGRTTKVTKITKEGRQSQDVSGCADHVDYQQVFMDWSQFATGPQEGYGF
jgi:hypothetical protein